MKNRYDQKGIQTENQTNQVTKFIGNRFAYVLYEQKKKIKKTVFDVAKQSMYLQRQLFPIYL